MLKNSRKHSIRIAALFDHGLSLLCSCYTEEELDKFDIFMDRPCQNFIGSRSTYDNLNLIDNKNTVLVGTLKIQDKETLFRDLDNVLSRKHLDKIWEMLWSRWCEYEKLCNL